MMKVFLALLCFLGHHIMPSMATFLTVSRNKNDMVDLDSKKCSDINGVENRGNCTCSSYLGGYTFMSREAEKGQCSTKTYLDCHASIDERKCVSETFLL